MMELTPQEAATLVKALAGDDPTTDDEVKRRALIWRIVHSEDNPQCLVVKNNPRCLVVRNNLLTGGLVLVVRHLTSHVLECIAACDNQTHAEEIATIKGIAP